jgi:hypothetical protein
MKNVVFIGMLACLFLSCRFDKFTDKADLQFADQHFKTAIANIELYKIRYGYYPASLQNLDFLGDWDKMIFQSLDYEKLDTGYRLDVIKGMVKANPPELKYPNEFWQGLGIRKTNVLKGI